MFEDPRKKFLETPEQVRALSGLQTKYLHTPFEAFEAAIDIGIANTGVQKIADYMTLKKLSEDGSRWLSPDEANLKYPAGRPYRNEVKESVAQFNADVNRRNQLEKEILSNVNQQSLGSSFLPFAGGMVAGFVDPVNLALGSAFSIGARGIGLGLMRFGGSRLGGLGKFIAGGSIEAGQWVNGTLGQQISAEVFDQFVGNVALEAAFSGVDYGTQQDVTFEDFATNVFIGTAVGTGVGMGMRYLSDIKMKGPTNQIEAETAMNQADAGLRPNLDPIAKAQREGLTIGYEAPPLEGTVEGKRRSKVYTVDPTGKVFGEPKPDVNLVKGVDYSIARLYLPILDSSGGVTRQGYAGPTLGLNNIQLLASPIIARNAAINPLLLTANPEVRSVQAKNIKPIDIDVPASTVPKLSSILEDIYGKQKAKALIEENPSIKQLLLEAQYEGAVATEKIQNAVLGDEGNALVYTENEGTNKAYDVIEIPKEKNIDIDVLEPDPNLIRSPISDQHILEAQKELIEYAQNPDNLLITDSKRAEYRQQTEAPIVENPREKLVKLDEEIRNIDEELKILGDLEEVEVIPEGVSGKQVETITEPTMTEADLWAKENGYELDELIDGEQEMYAEYDEYSGDYDNVIEETFYEDNALYGVADIEGKKVDVEGKDFHEVAKAEDSEKLRRALKELNLCDKGKR